MSTPPTAEHQRLAESKSREADWRLWGPYVADRAWGTVREDYSADGDAWRYFPHEHARSRAYRWNEDAIGGFCNRMQNVCLGVAMWNEKDRMLKERLFGVTGPEGNHGEDVKEVYFYVDGTPTHSYQRMLYKYPQVAYPYDELVRENQARGYGDPEFEIEEALADAFSEGRYFDVAIEYAKAGQEDILCRITATNRSDESAPLHLLPHLWYRNTWSWGYHPNRPKPTLEDATTTTDSASGIIRVKGNHHHLGERWWSVQAPGADVLFTDNETNFADLFGQENESPYVKDAFHRAIVDGEKGAVNPDGRGTKAAAHVRATVAPGESLTVCVRYSPQRSDAPFADFDVVFEQRIEEADAFYAHLQKPDLTDDERSVQRQAFAGLTWTKQFYHYSPKLWLDGDPAFPPPPPSRKRGRNSEWTHLYALDVLSMPDTWEYPWFAAWDLAFHMIPMALIDPGVVQTPAPACCCASGTSTPTVSFPPTSGPLAT